MKKRRLLALFAATAVLAGTMFAAGCSKDTDSEPAASETFAGVVCSQTFASQEDAAKNYIATEISGEDYSVTYTEYAKEADLTEEEITQLNISSEIDGTIDGVEKGKIYFSEVNAASAVATAAGEVNLYVTVYIIKYTPAGTTTSTYKYIIPLPANNEVLSYSYYNSVMNPANFKNCTATVTTTVTASGQTSSTTQTMQITESAVKMSLTVPTDDYGHTTNAAVYLVDSAQGVQCAIEVQGQCMVVNSSYIGLEIDSISEIYASNLNEAQCSLFLKTDYGFKMREEAINGIVESAFDAIFSEYEHYGMTVDWTMSKAECTYKVVDGKLYKTSADLGIDMTVSMQGETVSSSAASRVDVVYTNYGTTSVTISNIAKQMLGIN